jgi:hypothetical protein
MSKTKWEGWQKDAGNAAQPTGPITKRDGELVISLNPGHIELARKLALWHRDQARLAAERESKEPVLKRRSRKRDASKK